MGMIDRLRDYGLSEDELAQVKAGNDVPSKVKFVKRIPTCDICAELEPELYIPGFFDAGVREGPWGHLCEEHFLSHSWGRLGLGLGQCWLPGGE